MVQKILPKLDWRLLELISCKHIEELDLSELTTEKLREVFCSGESEVNKERTALVPTPMMQAILEKINESGFLENLSDKHIAELDRDKLDRYHKYWLADRLKAIPSKSEAILK
jgi:hypothetical protein